MVDPIDFISEQRRKILQTYEELHMLAEPSWKEEETSLYLREKLSQAGFKIKTFSGHYGFTAELKGQKEAVIALRADMDALLQEVDGTVQANHSCGHDAHSTMVLSAAVALAKTNLLLTHTVRFIFQPAEEKAEGALKMIEDGALENVMFLCGIHLRPSYEVPFNKAAPVIQHGSTASLKGIIKGMPSHAARPEEGNNPIEAAALLIQAMWQIRLQETGKYSIKITELHGGEASNLIPETTRFTFDLRAEANDTMGNLLEKAKHILEKTASLTETEITYSVEEFSPAAVKNERAMALARKAIHTVLGEENLEPACLSPGAEDFHFYTLKNPDLAATMIGLGCDLKPGLHHPNMAFNKEALIYGAQILAKVIMEADQKEW
ncbi:amidohydrolase [Cytobacillus oceanisediminis]|jgi:amidohydrolase|uniref:Amidohydrolase n=1 Tax=Cytobacillus oceanisediminis TaxID=665099 RepID=A0A2V2ZBK5_9BACI|nr:amidohydrolase [Cytobacillus oceanisediminis]PWW17433.1 amidohydrolase [Cytobacillus oceanisediminis]